MGCNRFVVPKCAMSLSKSNGVRLMSWLMKRLLANIFSRNRFLKEKFLVHFKCNFPHLHPVKDYSREVGAQEQVNTWSTSARHFYLNVENIKCLQAYLILLQHCLVEHYFLTTLRQLRQPSKTFSFVCDKESLRYFKKICFLPGENCPGFSVRRVSFHKFVQGEMNPFQPLSWKQIAISHLYFLGY